MKTRGKSSQNDYYRHMAVASLKKRALARMRGDPDPGTQPLGSPRSPPVDGGIDLTDEAARHMADAIKKLLKG